MNFAPLKSALKTTLSKSYDEVRLKQVLKTPSMLCLFDYSIQDLNAVETISLKLKARDKYG